LNIIHVDKLIYKNMLKLRFKRMGRKRSPFYRLVIIENTTKRDGRPVDEVGYYNPITKKCSIDLVRVSKWLNEGVKPSPAAARLLNKLQ